MALKVTLDIGETQGVIEINAEANGAYFAGGIWRPETGYLDVSWYSENGDNVVNPDTGESTKSRTYTDVQTIRDLQDKLVQLIAEESKS